MDRLHDARVRIHSTDVCEVIAISESDLKCLGVEPVMNDPRDGQIFGNGDLGMEIAIMGTRWATLR